MISKVSLVLVPLLAIVEPRPAVACVPVVLDAHELDALHANDSIVPSAPEVTSEVKRLDENTCGDLGVVVLDVDATDDATPTDRLGYRLRVRGDVPEGFASYDFDVVPSGGSIVLYFIGSDDDFGFDIDVSAVDLNGNVSTPTAVSIEPSGGCSSGRSNSGSLVLLALLSLWIAVRTRR